MPSFSASSSLAALAAVRGRNMFHRSWAVCKHTLCFNICTRYSRYPSPLEQKLDLGSLPLLVSVREGLPQSHLLAKN